MASTLPIRSSLTAAALALVVVVQGCAGPGPASADSYTVSQAQREQTVRLATVETVRAVKLSSGDTSGLGLVGGGAVGAVAGSALGGGRGSLLTGILGGLAGAVAGNAAEKGLGTSNGVEVTVRLDNGDLRAITQNASGEVFRAGERVRLLTSGGVTRVTH
ncbi:MAG: glycine zipper 2TM domain-containing protein [Janthinobacterium lividum]